MMSEIVIAPRCLILQPWGQAMFDARGDLAALVYEADQDPDTILRDFAADLNARGLRAVGMVQAGQCADSSLSAVLLDSGETLLLADASDPAASCRLDVIRLQNAGDRVAAALDAGADLLVINRFGKRERNGHGLVYLIERALEAGTPVVIAVSSDRLPDWIKFAGDMTVKLACDRQALDGWWREVSVRVPGAIIRDRESARSE
jgi:nucleoside-triphosphatase THEP1